MPPKKTTSETPKPTTPGEEATPSKETKEKEFVSIEDHTLPKSIVTRLAKGVLPPNTQIQANATLAITKGATVFVNYLASHANDICQVEGRKTINQADVLRALKDIEFEDFAPRLESELEKYIEIQTDKRTTAKAKKASEKSTTTAIDPATGQAVQLHGGDEHGAVGENGEPAAKKARRDVDEGKDGEDEADDSFALGGAGRGHEGDETEAEEEEVEYEEDTLEVDEAAEEEVEDRDNEEEDDEALDNGGDSD